MYSVGIFGDLLPKCCVARTQLIWKWYHIWCKAQGYEENTCMHCGMPAYTRWDKSYYGLRGFVLDVEQIGPKVNQMKNYKSMYY
jgi:hypothetical protein